MTRSDLDKMVLAVTVNPKFRIAELLTVMGLIVGGVVWVTNVDNRLMNIEERHAVQAELGNRLQRLENEQGSIRASINSLSKTIDRMWPHIMRRSRARPDKIAAPIQLRLPCFNRKAVGQMLAKKGGQQVEFRGYPNNEVIVELFTAPNGRWTILATSPKGHSCLLAAGKSFDRIPRKSSGHPGI